MKQFYTSDEAVTAAEAPKVKKKRPNTPNVPPQPTAATSILDPDQKELNEEEIVNLKAELKEQVESRQELDASIAKKMKRLKELREDKGGAKKRIVNMHYILSDNKVGKVAVDLESGVVLYSDLLDGVVYQKPKPKQQSVCNNTQVTSTKQNNTVTVEGDPNDQAPNLSATETTQPDLPAKKKKVKKKKQYVLDEKNVCWIPKRMKEWISLKTRWTRDMQMEPSSLSDCLRASMQGSWPSQK
jgi:hypothetical protein